MNLLGQKCSRCSKHRTRKSFEGVPTCDVCELAIKAAQEDLRQCPFDSNTMKKDVVHYMIIDRCEKCGGVWLDGGDLKEQTKLCRSLAKTSLIPMAMPVVILLYILIKAFGADGHVSPHTLAVSLLCLGGMYARYESFSTRAKALDELNINVISDDSAEVTIGNKQS